MRRSSPQRHSMPIRVVTRLAFAAPTWPLAARPAAAVPAPASANPRFADVRLSTGVRLRYLEQGDPAGRPVILLHGLTDSWFSSTPSTSEATATRTGPLPDMRRARWPPT
jgi:hypothetical protein